MHICLGQDATALLLAKSVCAKWGDPQHQSSAKVILTSTHTQVRTVSHIPCRLPSAPSMKQQANLSCKFASRLVFDLCLLNETSV